MAFLKGGRLQLALGFHQLLGPGPLLLLPHLKGVSPAYQKRPQHLRAHCPPLSDSQSFREQQLMSTEHSLGAALWASQALSHVTLLRSFLFPLNITKS